MWYAPYRGIASWEHLSWVDKNFKIYVRMVLELWYWRIKPACKLYFTSQRAPINKDVFGGVKSSSFKSRFAMLSLESRIRDSNSMPFLSVVALFHNRFLAFESTATTVSGVTIVSKMGWRTVDKLSIVGRMYKDMNLSGPERVWISTHAKWLLLLQFVNFVAEARETLVKIAAPYACSSERQWKDM